MNITITEKLKTFRRDKGNTQDELATHLGISTQAVSKWERGEGYPDITLLPAIAAYYGTSVDYLLGCSEIENQKKKDEYFKQYNTNSNLGKIEDNITLMRQALKEFPNDLDISEKLVHYLYFVDKKEYIDEVISRGEEILQKSVCDTQRYLMLQTLAFANMQKEDYDKAKEYANKLPDSFCTRNSVLESILKGDELHKLTQSNIGIAVNSIDFSVTWMLRSKEYTPEEKVFAYETVANLYDLFLYDGNYGYEHSGLHMLYMNIAEEYAKMKNTEKVMQALNKTYNHACVLDNFATGKYTSIFSDTGEYSKEGFSRNFENSYMEWLKNIMENQVFDYIRNTDSFKELYKSVSEHK
ncbi:MAG: hypothetical protein A2Y17_11420 [Clostridiales bacterium GWF2_38_85]|nr:MAG: hypothetical protein A2Y17_11420 [Clostridiales bacterium GWF2_38_85]HBL85082.1 hypothetical protein [Clostridiales bacterium]